MAKKGRHFFAKNIRYRENSLMRPKQNGDRTQSFDTNPIDNELDRRITIHSKDNESTGENQLVRGHKRFNDTIQMVDRDPFYSGYLRTQQATDNDSNVYTDSGRFPAMSLFAKNRLVTEDPEQAEGREAYSGIGVSTQTFSGLGEDVMMKKANAGLLFSSLLGSSGWETEASLGNKNFYMNIGASKTDGVQLNVRNITHSPYHVPVRSLPYGDRLLLVFRLEQTKISGNDEHNQAIDNETTYAGRIFKLMRKETIPDSLLNIVPDMMPIYEVIRDTGDKNITELYEWCTSRYASPSLDKLIARLNTLTFSTSPLDSEKKRICLYEYLRTLVFSAISRVSSSMDKTLSDLLPFTVYASKNINVSSYRRNYIMEYISNYGSYSGCLHRTLPWEGVFDATTNQQLFDIIEGWFIGSDGTSLKKLYEIIAPLGGELLNTYLDTLLKRHGCIEGLDTSVYDAVLANVSYETIVEGLRDYDKTGELLYTLESGDYITSVRCVFDMINQASGGSVLLYIFMLIFVALPALLIIYMFVQTSPKNLDLQLAGLESLLFPYSESTVVTLSENSITMKQLRFIVVANALNWISSGTTDNVTGIIRVITSGLCYVEDSLDDGGLKITGSQGVVTVSPSNPLATTVNFKGINEIQTNHLTARTIDCPDHLCGVSALIKKESSHILEVPIGGIVLANPHKQFTNEMLHINNGKIELVSSLEVEVCESESTSSWTWAGCLPFKFARYNADEKDWSSNYSDKLLQQGTYRLMSLLPTDVGVSYDNGYSRGVVLMQKISDKVRTASNSSKSLCNLPHDKVARTGDRVTLYPSSCFIKMLELNDGTYVFPRRTADTYPLSGYVYPISIEYKSDEITDYVSGGEPYYLVIGDFAYSALRFRKKSGASSITNFFPNRSQTMGSFRESGGAWKVDLLEFGIYNPLNGKFLALQNVLSGGDEHWESLETTNVVNDTSIHYMMARTTRQDGVPYSEAWVYKMTTSYMAINQSEPVVLFPKNPTGLVILKELGGVLNVYLTSDEEIEGRYIVRSYSYTDTMEKLHNCVCDYSHKKNFTLSDTNVVVKNVKYVTFSKYLYFKETGSATMFEPCTKDATFYSYETEPSLIYPARIDPTTMTAI